MTNVTGHVVHRASPTPVMITVVQHMTVGLHACPKSRAAIVAKSSSHITERY
jgi:hypothetical protein